MKIKNISLSGEKKLSVNYNSEGYHIGISIKLNRKDTILQAYNFGVKALNAMEKKEMNKIKESLL